MKIIVKILSLCFILIPFKTGFGQEIPWRYRTTEINHTLIIDTTTEIDIPNYSGAGVLGVFYDSSGVDVCVGYVDLTQRENYLIAYGEAEKNSGITAGEKFIFKLWDKEWDCIFDDVSVVYSTTEQAPNTGVFINNGVSKIVAIEASAIVINYVTDLVCPNDGALPIVSDSGGYIYSFSAEEGLRMDQNTGIINASNSKPGDYVVNVSSEYCISNPSHNVRVSYSDINIPKQHFKCVDELININDIATEVTDSWKVYDSLDITDEVDAGEYNVSFVNTDGCIVDQKIQIVNYQARDIQFETEYNCESTTVRLAADTDIETVEWSNNATGNSIEVYDNTNIEVRYTDSNRCSYEKSIDVAVKKLQIQSLETKILPADCYLKGSIEISDASIENKIGDLRYEFVNKLTNESFLSSNQLTEGKYQIIVSDDRNCTDTWSQELIIIKDCLKDRPVFSPNNDYVDDKYYISDPGFAEIYNRNGTKVGEFETPIYWDGTNQQGQKLPMGTYLIVINNKKVINITILR